MKAPIALLLPALLLGACSHTRETTIIEKPVSSREVIVPSRSVVIERPTVSREVIVEERPVVVERRVVLEHPSYRTCPSGTRAYYVDGGIQCRSDFAYWCQGGSHRC